ncbi:MAG: hypothetical protein RR197_06215 [Oscillospiraceae bacterium]
MTKQQYAARYDRAAAELYRFALLALGDPCAAQQVVRQAFVEGWRSGADGAEEAFFCAMLRLVSRLCRRIRPAQGAQYARGMRNDSHAVPEGRLLAVLGAMGLPERMALLYTALFGFDAARQAALGLFPVRPAESAARTA